MAFSETASSNSAIILLKADSAGRAAAKQLHRVLGLCHQLLFSVKTITYSMQARTRESD